jgi:hypothetical protein
MSSTDPVIRRDAVSPRNASESWEKISPDVKRGFSSRLPACESLYRESEVVSVGASSEVSVSLSWIEQGRASATENIKGNEGPFLVDTGPTACRTKLMKRICDIEPTL